MANDVLTRAALVTSIAAGMIAPAAPGVVVRHDIDDAACRRAAQRESFDAVGRLLANDTLLGTGTLICDGWVLTSAHVVDDFGADAWRFDVGGRRHHVEAIFVNPGWTGDPDGGHDLALLRLAEPYPQVASLSIFRGADDLGTPVSVLGYGYTGDGRTGVRFFDGGLRAATNVLEEFANDYILFFFDEPGSRYETPREGIAAFNDSGGPVIVETDDGPRVAGTHAFLRDWNENGVLADYGDLQAASRVVLHLHWLDGVLAACPADLDANHEVGFPDLLRVLSAWGTCGTCVEDVDVSGNVDLNDIVAVLAAWGACR